MFCIIETKKARFELEINRFLTLIQGYSGTGKTYLCNMIRDRRAVKTKIICQKRVVALSQDASYEESWFQRNEGSLIFVDEAITKLVNHRFVSLAQKYDCWVVICARNVFRFGCSYSVDSCLQLVECGNSVKTQKRFNVTDTIIGTKYFCEDEKSGYQFFKADGLDVIALEGNDSIVSYVLSHDVSGYTFIVDSAAFGDNFIELYQLFKAGQIGFVMRESFEFILLNSRFFKFDVEVCNNLDDTEMYCNSQKYTTWEQYYTELLSNKTDELNMIHYPIKKGRLPSCYTEGCAECRKRSECRATKVENPVEQILLDNALQFEINSNFEDNSLYTKLVDRFASNLDILQVFYDDNLPKKVFILTNSGRCDDVAKSFREYLDDILIGDIVDDRYKFRCFDRLAWCKANKPENVGKISNSKLLSIMGFMEYPLKSDIVTHNRDKSVGLESLSTLDSIFGSK